MVVKIPEFSSFFVREWGCAVVLPSMRAQWRQLAGLMNLRSLTRLTQVRDIAPPVNRLTAGKNWLSEVGEGINGAIDLRTCSQAIKHPIDIDLVEGLCPHAKY